MKGQLTFKLNIDAQAILGPSQKDLVLVKKCAPY